MRLQVGIQVGESRTEYRVQMIRVAKTSGTQFWLGVGGNFLSLEAANEYCGKMFTGDSPIVHRILEFKTTCEIVSKDS